MRIRCERCATVYELDDRRLPARGALVKCTRCQHVFRAAPPGAAPASSTPSPAAAVPKVTAVAAPEAGGETGGTDAAASSASPGVPPAPGEEKTALFGFSRAGEQEKTENLATAPPPSTAAPGREGGGRASSSPAGRPVEVSGGRSSLLWVVLAVALLVALLVGAWLTLRKRPDPAAAARRAVLEHLVARDDRPALEQAGDMGTDELAGGPQAVGALALALLAADAADELRPLEARERFLADELAREDSVRAAGWRERRDGLEARLARARLEAGNTRIRRTGLLARSAAALAAARAVEAPDVDLLRAAVAIAAANGDAGEVLRLSAPARGADATDPWIEAMRAAAAGDVGALQAVVERARPIVRARVLLARAQHGQGRDGEAVALLDEVIAANPEHERAKAWKAEILAPPPASVSQVAVPGRAPPVTEKGYLPRLRPRR